MEIQFKEDGNNRRLRSEGLSLSRCHKCRANSGKFILCSIWGHSRAHSRLNTKNKWHFIISYTRRGITLWTWLGWIVPMSCIFTVSWHYKRNSYKETNQTVFARWRRTLYSSGKSWIDVKQTQKHDRKRRTLFRLSRPRRMFGRFHASKTPISLRENPEHRSAGGQRRDVHDPFDRRDIGFAPFLQGATGVR